MREKLLLEYLLLKFLLQYFCSACSADVPYMSKIRCNIFLSTQIPIGISSMSNPTRLETVSDSKCRS